MSLNLSTEQVQTLVQLIDREIAYWQNKQVLAEHYNRTAETKVKIKEKIHSLFYLRRDLITAAENASAAA